MGAFSRVLGGSRREDELATERAAYAEIGRIVAIPFTVANVYERFADEVSKIIPFDLIVITCTDIDRSLVTICQGRREGVPLRRRNRVPPAR